MNQKLEKDLINIKILTLEMIKARGFGHLGGSFSIIEVLTVLFGSIMRTFPNDIKNPERDYFVLSKGHAGPAYYATLAHYGYFKEEILLTLNQNNTILPSHPDRNLTPGVDSTTGSLGQGISQAVGIAYGLKMQGKNNKVYCIIGDGECNEGEVWEALLFAQNKSLDNLVIIVDDNKQQVDGETKNISFKFDFEKIFSALGFLVRTAIGNDMQGIEDELDDLCQNKGQAKVLILDSVKGNSLPYYENNVKSHHLRLTDKDEERFEMIISSLKKMEG